MHNVILRMNVISCTNKRCSISPKLAVERLINENTRSKKFLARYRQIKDKDAHVLIKECINKILVETMWFSR